MPRHTPLLQGTLDLLRAGRRQLKAERDEWTRVAGAMRAALESP